MTNKNAVNIFRRLSLVFYSNQSLDKFQAPPAITPEEVLLKSAQDAIKEELIATTIRCAKKILTAHQRRVFTHLLENKSKYKIAAAMGYTNLRDAYYCVFAALHGRPFITADGTKRYWIGGLYKKLRIRLEKNRKVKKLLKTLDEINQGDHRVALEFLKSKDQFWETWGENLNEDNSTW